MSQWIQRVGSLNPKGWRDIEGPVVVRVTGTGRPVWSQIGSTAFWAYKFAVDDSCWFTYHIPHDIDSPTVHFHSHFLLDAGDTEEVKWEYTYAYAKGYDQEAFALASPLQTTSTLAGSATPYTHQIAESVAVTIPGLTEPDGLIMANIKRVTNGGGTENLAGVFMITSDVHYKSNNRATAIRTAPYS